MFRNFFILLFIFSFFGRVCYSSYSKIVEEIGDYTQILLPVYAFGMSMNENSFEGVYQFLYSFSSVNVSTQFLKHTIKEKRPDNSDNRSFPSGHTSSAFMGASFIHKRYGIKRAIIPYLMAGFVGYSRIEAKKHHWWDVLAGAGLGISLPFLFVSKNDNFNINIDTNYFGLNFKTNF